MNSLIHRLTKPSCTDSLVHWFTEPSIDPLHWFNDSLIHRFNGSVVGWFTGSWSHFCFIGSLIHWLICSSIHYFIGSFTQLCTASSMSFHWHLNHHFLICWRASQLQPFMASASQKRSYRTLISYIISHFQNFRPGACPRHYLVLFMSTSCHDLLASWDAYTGPMIFAEARKRHSPLMQKWTHNILSICMLAIYLRMLANSSTWLPLLGVHSFAIFLIAAQPLGLWSKVLPAFENLPKGFPTTFGGEVTTDHNSPPVPPPPPPSGLAFDLPFRLAVPWWPSSNLVFCCFYSRGCETMKQPMWAANPIFHNSTNPISWSPEY